MQIVLASSSKARLKLLGQIGIEPIVKLPSIIEDIYFIDKALYNKAVVNLAIAKASDAANNFHNNIIIGADTIIVYKGEIFQKPKTTVEAKETITILSGKTHTVVTGLCMINTVTNKKLSSYTETTVKFRKLTEVEIEWYMSSRESMEHAGSYSIQGKAGLFVDSIEGSYSNVVGLPLNVVGDYLNKLDYKWL